MRTSIRFNTFNVFKANMRTVGIVLLLMLNLMVAAEGRPLVVQVSLISKANENAVIGVTLQNDSDSTVYMWGSTMPWSMGGDGMKLIALRNEPGAIPVTDRSHLGFESGAGFASIAPHSKLYRELQLCEMIASLEKDRMESEIILFWTHNSVAYKNKTIEDPISNRSGGMLVIPRTTRLHANSVKCLPRQ